MGETIITGEVDIRRPIDVVFDYVTTPKHWPTWYPLTAKIEGSVESSLEPQNTCTETVCTAILKKIFCLRSIFTWSVVEKTRPTLFIFNVKTQSEGRITYRFEQNGEYTIWKRELIYTPGNFFWSIANKLLVEQKIREASAQALHNVKNILENFPKS